MLRETLDKIDAQLRTAGSLPPEKRQELLQLLEQLKGEVDDLSKTDAEQALSIAGFTAVSAYEATRREPDPKLVSLSLQGLSSAANGFEQSHPRLVQVVNSISTTLSNLGI